MKTLIVEDDFTSRLLLQKLLAPYGAVDIAVNGREAVTAVAASLDSSDAYQLICLDIMMPEMDGYEALKQIRGMEEARGILPPGGAKIVMTTALERIRNVMQAFQGLCDAYVVKPVDKAHLLEQLHALELI